MTPSRESKPPYRVGIGYDVHRLEPGHKLWLCGQCVESERGAVGHSDADTPLHALCDALLGAVALGDIGTHFPDTNAQYKGAPSRLFVEEVARMVRECGYEVGNVDIVIALQAPKIAPHIPAMRRCVADALGIELGQVSIKATTTERLGFVGEERGVMAQAVALVYRVPHP